MSGNTAYFIALGRTLADVANEAKSFRAECFEATALVTTEKSAPAPKPRQFAGLRVMVENPKGSIRCGKARNGKRWSVLMKNDYGYLSRANGEDGEGLDVFLGPDEKAENAYVVHQQQPETKQYDEDKVMLGFPDVDAAKSAYLSNYNTPDFFRSITVLPMDTFKGMLNRGEPGGVHWKRKMGREHESTAIFSSDDAGRSAVSELVWQMRAVRESSRQNFDDADGRWVTIGSNKSAPPGEKGGSPVFIGEGGKIEKGPAGLVGKRPDQLKKHPLYDRKTGRQFDYFGKKSAETRDPEMASRPGAINLDEDGEESGERPQGSGIAEAHQYFGKSMPPGYDKDRHIDPNDLPEHLSGQPILPSIEHPEQMTGDEYRQARIAHDKFHGQQGGAGVYGQEHEEAVAQAINRGDDVPEHVLDEYPHLLGDALVEQHRREQMAELARKQAEADAKDETANGPSAEAGAGQANAADQARPGDRVSFAPFSDGEEEYVVQSVEGTNYIGLDKHGFPHRIPIGRATPIEPAAPDQQPGLAPDEDPAASQPNPSHSPRELTGPARSADDETAAETSPMTGPTPESTAGPADTFSKAVRSTARIAAKHNQTTHYSHDQLLKAGVDPETASRVAKPGTAGRADQENDAIAPENPGPPADPVERPAAPADAAQPQAEIDKPVEQPATVDATASAAQPPESASKPRRASQSRNPADKVFGRKAIAERLEQAFKDQGGDTGIEDDKALADYHSPFTFLRTSKTKSGYPGEVEDFLARPDHVKFRKMFSLTDDPAKAQGADAMGDMGEDRYFELAERRAGGSLAAALDAARNSPDPEHRFLAALHDSVIPDTAATKAQIAKLRRSADKFEVKDPKKAQSQLRLATKLEEGMLKDKEGGKKQDVVPAADLQAGDHFTIHGIDVDVVEGPDGLELKDHGDLPETPVDALQSVPVDQGSRRSARSESDDSDLAALDDPFGDMMDEPSAEELKPNEPEHRHEPAPVAVAEGAKTEAATDGPQNPPSGDARAGGAVHAPSAGPEARDGGVEAEAEIDRPSPNAATAVRAPEPPSAIRKDLFGKPIIESSGIGQQGGMFHEPVAYNEPQSDNLGSANANDVRHTAEMFPANPPPKSVSEEERLMAEKDAAFEKRQAELASQAQRHKEAAGKLSDWDLKSALDEYERTGGGTNPTHESKSMNDAFRNELRNRGKLYAKIDKPKLPPAKAAEPKSADRPAITTKDLHDQYHRMSPAEKLKAIGELGYIPKNPAAEPPAPPAEPISGERTGTAPKPEPKATLPPISPGGRLDRIRELRKGGMTFAEAKAAVEKEQTPSAQEARHEPVSAELESLKSQYRDVQNRFNAFPPFSYGRKKKELAAEGDRLRLELQRRGMSFGDIQKMVSQDAVETDTPASGERSSAPKPGNVVLPQQYEPAKLKGMTDERLNFELAMQKNRAGAMRDPSASRKVAEIRQEQLRRSEAERAKYAKPAAAEPLSHQKRLDEQAAAKDESSRIQSELESLAGDQRKRGIDPNTAGDAPERAVGRKSRGHVGYFTAPDGQKFELYKQTDGSLYRAPVDTAIDAGTGNRIGRFEASGAAADAQARQLMQKGAWVDGAKDRVAMHYPIADPGSNGADNPATEPDGTSVDLLTPRPRRYGQRAPRPKPVGHLPGDVERKPLKRTAGFTTAQGSTYTVDENGRTQRTKSPHAGHETADVGEKDQSDATHYVSPEHAKAIGMHGSLSGKKALIRKDGRLYPVAWNEKEGRWGITGTDRDGFPFKDSPQVGDHPVELWGDGKGSEFNKWHSGSAITELSDAPKPAVAQQIGNVGQQLRQRVLALQSEAKKAGKPLSFGDAMRQAKAGMNLPVDFATVDHALAIAEATLCRMELLSYLAA